MDSQDEELLALLRAEVDGQAPPPVHTALDDVVRRGRRRLRTRRLGATLGVVAVVGGVGIATSILRLGMPGVGLPAGQINAASSVSGSPSPSTMSGWSVAPAEPQTSHAATDNCSKGPAMPDRPGNASVNVDTVDKVLLDALRQVAPKASVKITKATAAVRPVDQLLGSTWADVVDAGGAGSVYVEMHAFGGAPVQAADNEKFVDGGCTLPQRQVLADGTVLQLYPVANYTPAHPSQTLRVYTPAHVLYVIIAEGFASTDWVKSPDQPDTLSVPKDAGRHSLPLNEQQLTALATRVAGIG
ncbi:hypothetical protein [Kutzneria buriramensis]|uniref:hypothetical protein n=1 Tax=Kutzneria buriramensis TaxID=1045776 RepID=UPI0011C1536F|nr:hypothetical protein [Kutzneria buriramensis]